MGGGDLLSLVSCGKEGYVGASSKGCTSPIISKYLIWPLFFVKLCNKETRKRGIEELQESNDASLGWWESNTKERLKNLKVVQLKFCVVVIRCKTGIKELKSYTTHIMGDGYQCF